MATLESSLSFPRARRLSACLAASLGLVWGTMRSAEAKAPDPSPHAVLTCDDDINNPDSLRAQVAAAASGDTIDLTALQMTCSKITLGSEIEVQQSSLYFEGPGAADLAIDGDHGFRLFKHSGTGILGIHGLTLSNGHYTGNGMSSLDSSNGGCISSSGDVTLVASVVSDCVADDIGLGTVHGGGIFAAGNVTLLATQVIGNTANAANRNSLGGGIYASKAFAAKYSTISDNIVDAPSVTDDSVAGGVFVLKGPVTIESSTISGNRAEKAAGLTILSNIAQFGDQIINSTISGNESAYLTAGIWTTSGLAIYNSTIAFNVVSTSYTDGAGLYSQGPLNLESTIIADNVAQTGPRDLAGVNQMVAGSHNLVFAPSLLPPPNTIQAVCPGLQPLAKNAAGTRTHALRQAISSLAIDGGDNVLNLATDQRSLARAAGLFPDIGAVESQTGEVDEDIMISGFDGRCDL